MSIWRRNRGFIIGVAVLAMGWGLLRLATSAPSVDLVLFETRRLLEKELGLTLDVGHINVDAENAAVELGPVTVKGNDGVVLFSATRIALEMAPLQILARRIEVARLEIERPFIHVRVKDNRILGIKEIEIDEGGFERGNPLFRVDVRDFRLTDGKVVVSVDELFSATFDKIKGRMKTSGPDGHRLKFSVDEAFVDRPNDRMTLDRFDGRVVVFGDGLLAPERVSITDLSFRAPEGSLDVAGSFILGPLDRIPAFDLDVHGVGDFGQLLSHVDLPMPILGSVTVATHVSSSLGLENLHYAGQADIADLLVDGFSVGTLRGQFQGDDTHIAFPVATWAMAGTTMRCRGTFLYDDAINYEFNVEGEDLSIYDLLDDLQISGSWVDVKIDGTVDGRGHLLPDFFVEGHGNGFFHELVVNGRNARRATDDDVIITAPRQILVDADFKADLDHVRIDGYIDDGLTRADGWVTLNFDPALGFEVFAEEAYGSLASINDDIAGLSMTGHGDFQLQIAGPYDDPLIVAQVGMNDFTVGGYALADTGRSHIRFRDGLLGFHGVQGRRGKSDFLGDVVLDWYRPTKKITMLNEDGSRKPVPVVEDLADGFTIAIDIDLVRGEIVDLQSMIPSSFEDGAMGFFRTLEADGPIVASVKTKGFIGDGSIDHLLGDIRFSLGAGGHVVGQTLEGGGALVRMVEDRFLIDDLELKLAGGTAHGALEVWRDDGELTGPLIVRDLKLGGIDALSESSRPVSGSVDLDLMFSGLSENPRFTGRARVKDAAWGEFPIGDADLSLVHEDRVIVLDGPVLSRAAEGAFQVSTEGPYAYTAALNVVRGGLRRFLPPDTMPASTTVLLSGNVDVVGALSTFGESRGTLAMHTIDITDGALTLKGNGDVLAHFSGDRLFIDQMELVTVRGDRIVVGGLASVDELDVSVSGRGDLWMVSSLSDSIGSAGGAFAFDLALTGTSESASMNGQATVSRARFDFENFASSINDVDARLVFRGSHVHVEQVRGRIGTAPFNGRGTVTMNGTSPERYDLEMRYSDLRLAIPEWLKTHSSGTVTLTGDADMPTLAGEVSLHEALYTDDLNWEKLLPEFRRRTKAPLVFDKTEEDLRFDLHLVAERGIVVSNNVAEIEAKGDLWLTGTEERPGLKGNISLLNGTATFRNSRYRLTRGNVEFVETYAIAPILDVEAETRVKDYDITANISGPLKSMRIDLSSRPDLAEIDILALLTFGFTQLELQDATTTAGTTSLEVVSAYTGLDQEVKRILPEAVRESGVLTVDELRLTSQYSQRTQGTVPAVMVGFEVNPGFWGIDGSRLRLQSTLVDNDGSGTDQRVEWEKRFDNDLRLRLVWASQDKGACPSCTNQWGDFGGDVWYRWEF